MPLPAALQIAIQRERPCASDAEREEARDIEQVGLITGLAKMRARRVVGHELDRAEPVRKMDGKDRNQQHDNHRHRGERHKGASEYQQSAADLNDDRRPA